MPDKIKFKLFMILQEKQKEQIKNNSNIYKTLKNKNKIVLKFKEEKTKLFRIKKVYSQQ